MADNVCLVMEQPETFALFINDRRVEQQDSGHYRDTSFRKLPIPGMLRPGVNTIRLTTTFAQSDNVYENLRRARVFEAEKNKLTYDSEIEAIYLIGNFGVATPGTFGPLPRRATRYHGDFVLTDPPTLVELGNLVPCGLPFFNGTVRLRKTISLTADETTNRSFCLTEKMASVVGLRVNATAIKKWLWRPYEADLGDVLVPGDNMFEIELTGDLRNLLGPHHLEEGESYGVAPASFFKESGIWGSRPWNNDYCFVQFGVRV